MQREGEIVIPREDPLSWLCNTKWPARNNIHENKNICVGQFVFICLCVHCMCVCVCVCEGECWQMSRVHVFHSIHRKEWRGERKGKRGNDLIMFYVQKLRKDFELIFISWLNQAFNLFSAYLLIENVKVFQDNLDVWKRWCLWILGPCI